MTYAELFTILADKILEAHAAALPAEEASRNELRAAMAALLEPPETVIHGFKEGSDPWNWNMDTQPPSQIVSPQPEIENASR